MILMLFFINTTQLFIYLLINIIIDTISASKQITVNIHTIFIQKD